MCQLKKYLMFLLYCTGLVLGTVILNTQFNITALPYCSNLDWNFVNYIQLLVKRALELILIFIFLRILPVHIRTAAMFLISGCILGGLVSIRACSGSMLEALFYGIFVFGLVCAYMAALKIMLADNSGTGKMNAAKLHNSLAGKLLIITIVLINCALELKFLKFF